MFLLDREAFRITRRLVGWILQQNVQSHNIQYALRNVQKPLSNTTQYKWKASYAGMTVFKLRQMKGLEAENGQLKRLLADAMLDISGLKGLLAKKLLTATDRRDAVQWLMDERQFSTRRVCRLVGISQSSFAYQARPDRHARLRERLITLAGKHRRYGYRFRFGSNDGGSWTY